MYPKKINQKEYYLFLRSRGISKKEAKEMSYKALRKRGLPITPHEDFDRDGKPNAIDCRPLNRKKHSIASLILASQIISTVGTATQVGKDMGMIKGKTKPKKKLIKKIS